jgi:lysyl-tRNA synthetase class 2
VANIHVQDRQIFIEVEDRDDKFLFVLERDNSYSSGKAIDFTACVRQGDWVGFQVDGIFRNQSGGLIAHIKDWNLLAPCFLPLTTHEPDESRKYRQSFVNLAADIRAREHFITQCRVVRYMRRILEDRYQFLEVKTPILQPVDRRAETAEFELRASSEMYLAQFLVGGLERVYEIYENQRNEVLNQGDDPAFQMMQCAMAFTDVNAMMLLTEQFISQLTLYLHSTYVIPWRLLEPHQSSVVSVKSPNLGNNEECSPFSENPVEEILIDLTPPWPRRSVHEIVQEATGVDFSSIKSIDAAINAARSMGVEIQASESFIHVSSVLMKVIDQLVSPLLVQPTFLIDYPAEESLFAKSQRSDPRLAERCGLFINGLEFARGYSALTDPLERESRVALQPQKQALEERTTPASADDFTSVALYGMPPTGILRIEIDRLVMLMTGVTHIRDVVFSPY